MLVEGLILNKLVIGMFHYNVSPYELPSENKVFIIIIIIVSLTRTFSLLRTGQLKNCSLKRTHQDPYQTCTAISFISVIDIYLSTSMHFVSYFT